MYTLYLFTKNYRSIIHTVQIFNFLRTLMPADVEHSLNNAPLLTEFNKYIGPTTEQLMTKNNALEFEHMVLVRGCCMVLFNHCTTLLPATACFSAAQEMCTYL